MEAEPNLTAALAALAEHVEQSTRRLRELRERAPELQDVVAAVEERLSTRMDELARTNEEARANADRIVLLRNCLGDLEDQLVSFRHRLTGLAGIVETS